MIFTTIQTRVREQSSELFKDRGNPGDVPCPIGESRVFALALTTNPWKTFVYIDSLESYVHAAHHEGVHPEEGKPALGPIKDFVSPMAPPQIGVSFKQNNNKEEIVTEMGLLGFSKITSGISNYYVGGPSKPAMRRITQLGGDVDSFTAPQHSNIRGYMAFQFISYILYNFCRLPHSPHQSTTFDFSWTPKNTDPKAVVDDDSIEEHNFIFNRFEATWFEARDALITRKSEDIPEGHFLPYFTGMNTPDKHALPRILLTYFAKFFVSDAARTTLIKGFASLAATAAGIQLSHLAIVIEKAIILRSAVRVFMTGGGIYSGAIIETSSNIFKGNLLIKPLSGESLKEELDNFDTHDAALASVCATLSAMRLSSSTEKEPVKETVKPAEITTPRQLHDLCRERTFSPEQIKEMTSDIIKLSFTQNYWSATDVSSIKRAIISISDRNFLPMDAPMPYKTGVLFTKDIYTSTLAAFGDRVPTLSARGETAFVLSDKSESMFSRPATARLPGFPLYEARLAQATETWREMFKTGTLHMACNEKGKVLNIKNVKAIVSKDTDGGVDLSRTLAQHVALKAQDKKGIKRAREEKDEEEEERIKKKRDAKDKGKAESVFDDFFA